MTSFHLRCRVCEEDAGPEPLDACRRCDGPTDVTYDWDRVARTMTRETVARGPESLWRYLYWSSSVLTQARDSAGDRRSSWRLDLPYFVFWCFSKV